MEEQILKCIKKHWAMYHTGPTVEDIASLESLDVEKVSEVLAKMEIAEMVHSSYHAGGLRFIDA